MRSSGMLRERADAVHRLQELPIGQVSEIFENICSVCFFDLLFRCGDLVRFICTCSEIALTQAHLPFFFR